MFQKIPTWLKNKYAFSIFVFIIWVSFFDQNNLMNQYSYRSELNELKNQKDYFNQEIAITSQELEDLTKNPATLEKFARENYFMKKENEEVFVITTK